MHEHGICDGLVDLITTRAQGRTVAEVRLRIGARHAVVDEAFDQAFTHVAEGTVADGARLDLVVTPVTVDCRDCGLTSHSVDVLAVCVACGSADTHITGGDELVLESIRYRAPGEGRGDVPGHSG